MTRLDSARAARLLEAFSTRRLLVIGDLMLDAYLVGEVTRISPEAPVPVVRVTEERSCPGGAGNVAANAASLGARPLLLGVLGADAAGERFRAEAERSGISTQGVLEDPGRPTTVKTRLIGHHQQVARYDRETDRELDAALEDRLVAAFLSALAEADAVLVSDYAKGVLGARVLKEILPSAAARGVPVVVDPTVASFWRYEPVTCLTPNSLEASQASQVFGRDDEAHERMGRRILERLDAGAVLVTRGEAGMTLVERGGAVSHVHAFAREVYDVTGAGDTVSTVLALGLASGASLREAAELANHAAGVVVGKVGTASVTSDEVLASLARGAPPPAPPRPLRPRRRP